MDRSGGYHPEWGNPITKELTWYALTDKWILAQKLRIPKIQFAKLKKNEDQSVDTLLLLRMGNKIPIEGVTETKFGHEMKEWTIQRLFHLGIHPIYNHQTQSLLWTSTSACWQETDIAVFWESLPVPDKYRSGGSQPSIGQSTGSPVKELEKGPRSWRSLQPHRRNKNMN